MTANNTRLMWLLSGAAIILSACGDDQTAASKANFETALNAHYAKVKRSDIRKTQGILAVKFLVSRTGLVSNSRTKARSI